MTLLILLKLIAILILLLLSAISSGSETALTAVSKLQAHRQNEKGIKNSNFILKIKELKDEFITGILLANNVFNILATALMTELLVSEFGGFGVTVATIFMTIMIVIFSEVTPKIFAINWAPKQIPTICLFFFIISRASSEDFPHTPQDELVKKSLFIFEIFIFLELFKVANILFWILYWPTLSP